METKKVIVSYEVLLNLQRDRFEVVSTVNIPEVPKIQNSRFGHSNIIQKPSYFSPPGVSGNIHGDLGRSGSIFDHRSRSRDIPSKS